MENQNKLVPDQQKGKQVDLVERREFASAQDAELAFRRATGRLLRPQTWHELAGNASASFEVLKADAQKTEDPVEEFYFIRIDIPGPGSPAGEGYDWVRVERIEGKDKKSDLVGIKLVPCANPVNDKETTAHFFEEGSSSTLIVELSGNVVEASYKGRNEVINNATGKVAENIRNTIVGAGAKAGLSEAQWQQLIKSFLED
ncbi:MAG: hypothetical protein J7527_12720 [Chitinophagaceae bacterium]|nr:hypothetical protein [Chitinophagaceae bacterium]